MGNLILFENYTTKKVEKFKIEGEGSRQVETIVIQRKIIYYYVFLAPKYIDTPNELW